MTYNGSLPPADGNSYWWSDLHDAWIRADDDLEDRPETELLVTRAPDTTTPHLGIDDYHHTEQ